jgi:hypothetical protein
MSIITLLVASNVIAQPNSLTEYEVKAAFIYKFCLYIEWPPKAFTTANEPLVLGVIGPAEIADNLQAATQGHTVNGRTITIRRIATAADLPGLHLLFVAKDELPGATSLMAEAKKHPTLLVTESPTGLDAGGIINFTMQDSRVRFDVELSAAAQEGFGLSAQLLKVARIVRRGEA